ncbi:hypothetical protein VNI00_014295 [Paramarasmius palmivorus]|uniref:Fungal lipase-type domain-containing protein n=1 Tax=Paramarasmius palmivorus TaxID=297713 RepID=A0AAW0BUU9_9AGAR
MLLSQPVLQGIRDAHARQLAHFSPRSDKKPGKTPTDSDPDSDVVTLEDILQWINDHPEAIRAAKDAQCTSQSPDTPNWNTIFFAFIESTAVYFRKETEIVKAIKAARDGDFDTAANHIKEAQDDIDKVAEALDCKFVQLCENPDDTSFDGSGAFCGLFVSNDTQKPFMGVTYKGTANPKEQNTDLQWEPVAPNPPEVAWGASMHGGFFEGLFGRFASEGHQVAFEVMLDQLKRAYDDHGGNAMLHFTGHSLGGAYCTLAYGEFLRRQAESEFARYRFGDMYSLAAPRVCTGPFFQYVNSLTQAGGGKYLFRIVNSEDPVPTMPPPPPPLADSALYPFVHVGGAWKLLEEGPQKMTDEPPPVPPQSILDALLNAHYHGPKEYYANWQKTPHA